MMWLSAFFGTLWEMLADTARFVVGRGCGFCGSKHTTVQFAGKDKVHHVCKSCWAER